MIAIRSHARAATHQPSPNHTPAANDQDSRHDPFERLQEAAEIELHRHAPRFMRAQAHGEAPRWI